MGYWHIPMAADSCEKTAFATSLGLYEFEVMPFGLHNGLATLQRTTNHVLCGCQKLLRPIWTTLLRIVSSSEHLQHLREVFERIQQAGLMVKLKKCFFGQDHTCYLGHMISVGKVQPDPEKVQAVQDSPEPRTKKDVRSFLGLAGYNWHFILKFFYSGNPLT